jgi:hypothetical protein
VIVKRPKNVLAGFHLLSCDEVAKVSFVLRSEPV